MRALVLAAGKGERLKPLTDLRPKAMLPIVGKPLLHYIVDDLKLSGITDLILVVGSNKEMIQEYFKNGEPFGLKITYVEQQKPLGEADAILKAEKELSQEELFVMAHGDYIAEKGLVKKVVESHHDINSDITLAVSHVNNPSEYGIVQLDHKNRIKRIVEKPQDWGVLGDLAVSSIYVFNQDIFETLRKIKQLEAAISYMVRKGAKGIGVVWEKEWMDIGRPWDILAANRFILSKLFLKNPRYISPSASYKSEKQLEAPYHISDDVEIDHGAVVKGGCFLDIGSKIGTNALIRDYSYIGKDVVAGYSTEIKNSVILSNSSLGHIAYVGDSIIGAFCEIGAGVITSNFRFDEKTINVMIQKRRYDSGLRKLGAIIGDRVKIGVNSSVCPGCKIGSNTWISPGVMISHDIPENKFVSLDQKITIKDQKNKTFFYLRG